MNRINSTLRNIAVFIPLVILAFAVFWLVSRQASPQPIAQVTTQPASPTVTPHPTVSPSSAVTPNKTPIPTEQPIQSQGATPEPTATPFTPEAVQATVILITIEPSPTPVPTPTFEPLVGQAIGGYIFSQARPISNTLGYSLPFFDWLPDNPHKLLTLIHRNGISLEVIDVNTGEVQTYHNGNALVYHPIWLPTRQAVAYLTVDEQDPTKQHIWISSNAQGQMVPTANLAFVTSGLPPLITSPDGNGIITFTPNWQLTQIGTINNQSIKLANDTEIYVPLSYDHLALYKAAQSMDKHKAIYFNNDWLLLADFTTGKIAPIELESLKTEDMPPTTYVQNIVWSPDNSKLALLVATGGVGDGNNLFILDLLSEHLNFIRGDFHYIAGLDWAPDNNHLIISGVIGEREGYNVNALFMVDTISGDIQPVPAVPFDAIGSIPNWSPDGSQIAVLYADEPGNPGLYLIDVQLP